MRAVPRLRLSLASRILVFQLAIILGALLMGGVVSALVASAGLDSQYENRARNVGTRKGAHLRRYRSSRRHRIRWLPRDRPVSSTHGRPVPLYPPDRRLSAGGRGPRRDRLAAARPPLETPDVWFGARRDLDAARTARGQPARDP